MVVLIFLLYPPADTKALLPHNHHSSMLPKHHRLTTKQFDHVWSHGVSACGAFVCVRLIAGMPDARYSCIAPKKHARTAVQRNRLRRRLYGACAPILHDAADQHTHAVISPKSALDGISPTALRDDIARTLRKARARTK